MATLNLNKAEFLKSAVSPSGFLAADLPCIVFAGKSNVGKSSVINRLLNRKNFARVGSQPGKTVHVNYFCIDGRAYFVDLPGYGYASVAKTERARWGKLMEDFFADPARITLGVMIVDARHKPTADDETMVSFHRLPDGRRGQQVRQAQKVGDRAEPCAHPGHAFAAGRCGAPAVFGGEGHRPRGAARRDLSRHWMNQSAERAFARSAPQSSAGQSFLRRLIGFEAGLAPSSTPAAHSIRRWRGHS